MTIENRDVVESTEIGRRVLACEADGLGPLRFVGGSGGIQEARIATANGEVVLA